MNARLPAGFTTGGVHCGVKGDPTVEDVSLFVCPAGATAAAVYTQNRVVAAPVVLDRQRTPSEDIRVVVVNSGNANACTGEMGKEDAQEMTEQVASRVGCDPSQVLVMSTGVIGQRLPMDRVRQGIDAAYEKLDSRLEAFRLAADAICTTDQSQKVAFISFAFGDRVYRLAAMAKGAGMIAPNLATMLALVLTDAPLTRDQVATALTEAAKQSFNRISVDGHTSTNDTMLLLASGRGTPLEGPALFCFQSVLNSLSIDLAKLIVADGEGATHVMAIRVEGAASDDDAEVIARTVGASPLVKTAITGGDPNWGRIVSAAGYAQATFVPVKTCLKVCGETIYDCGTPLSFDAANLSRRMKRSPEVSIELRVGDGPGEATFWASDLTTDYVRFNSEYTT